MPAVLSRAEGGGTMAMGSKDEARADAGAPAKHAAENVWDHHDEARSAKSLSGSGSIPQPTGYLPSSASQSMASVSLAAIGVQSRNRTWAILVGGALLFLVLGALGMYAIMKTGQGETAHASEGLAQNDRGTTPEPEIDIGTPLPEGAEPPDTDFIAGGVRPSETGEERPTMSTVSMTSMAETSMTSMEGSISTMSTEMTSTMSTEMQTEVATMETTTMESTMTETPDMTDTVPEETDERDLEFELYVGRVRYAIRRYYAPRAQSCFEHATRNDPNVRGTVVVRFSINADGSVTNSSVLRNTTGNEALGRCLANQALTWRLPQTYNGETIPLEIPFAR
jgi:TonB family protein